MKKTTALILAGTLCVFGIAARAAADAVIKDIRAQLRPDFTVVVDGEITEFKNAQGDTVYPILYNGTTYLPLRSAGELMNKQVYWYEDDKRIELRDPEETLVTDADVIIPAEDDRAQTADKAQTPGLFGAGNAKKVALAKAGLKAPDVTFTKVKLERDDGIYRYDIEFRTDAAEYDVKVNAADGNIISFEREAIKDKENTTVPTAEPERTEFIGEEKALKIALEKAGLSEDDISAKKVKLDRDDGVYVYEVEFRSGTIEYEAEISAADGKVLSFEKDIDD